MSVGGLHASLLHKHHEYSEKYYLHCDKFPLDYFRLPVASKGEAKANKAVKKTHRFEFNPHVFDEFPLGEEDRQKVFLLCSDVTSGKRVWMNTSDIEVYKKCLQATISLPKIFPPVRVGNLLLQDGSIYDSFPLDECMDCPTLGCGKESDLVIAINLDLNHVKCRHEDNPKVKTILIPQEFHEQSICSKKTMLQMIDCGYEIRKSFL